MIITGKLDKPQPFGRFVLTAHIASGGMAAVYVAEALPGDPLHGKKLALKIMHTHLALSEDFVRMFRDEGRLTSRLDHPNVVRVYEVGEHDGCHFLVMDFIEGRDLHQVLNTMRLHRQTLSPPLAFEVLRQTLTALSYVHKFRMSDGRAANIVHRDISPQNLLISNQPQPLVKLTDFGIARFAQRDVETRAGTVKGKMHYMAPEQASGRKVDARADLYSLGAVAFEMLTGAAPFGAANTTVAHKRAMRGEVEFGRAFLAQPADVQAWLSKALAVNPDERFQSADAMLAAMEQIVKANKSHYRAEKMLRLLALPENSRRVQRAAKEQGLFVGDDAVDLGRMAGAVTTGSSHERQLSKVTGRLHADLPLQDRDQRLLSKQVVWDAPEPVVRPAPEAPAVREPLRPRGREAAQLLPAEQATGRSYAVAPASGKFAAAQAPSAPVSALAPQSLSAATLPDDMVDGPSPAAMAATPSRTRIARIDLERHRGMGISVAAAWLCAAFLLASTLFEIVAWTPQLPELDERAVAAFFDLDGADKPATDAVATSAGAALPRREPPRVAHLDAPIPPTNPEALAVSPTATQTAEVQVAAPPAAPAKPTPAEIDERRLASQWSMHPLERVVAADAPDPERPADAKAAKRAPATKADAATAAKAAAVVAKPVAAPVAQPTAAPTKPAAPATKPAAAPGKPLVAPAAKPAAVAAKPVAVPGKPLVVPAAKPAAVAAKPVAAPGKPLVAPAAKPAAVAVKPLAAPGKPLVAPAAKPAAVAAKPVAAPGKPLVAPAAKPAAVAAKPVAAPGKPLVAPAAKPAAVAAKPVAASGAKLGGGAVKPSAPQAGPVPPAKRVANGGKAPVARAATQIAPAKTAVAKANAPRPVAKPAAAGKTGGRAR